jgi:primosomal protein N'
VKNIYTIDLTKDKSKISEYISETLITKIEESLKNSKKIILYLNKR